jgi:hypothetical protein
MPERDDLDRSIADGIITPEQAAAIRARRADDEEPFKLVSNFGDVFLCVGLLFVYWSQGAFLRLADVPPLWVHIGFAVLFWLIAEFFVFSARRKFPAVVAIVLFTLSVHKTAGLWLGDISIWGMAFGYFAGIESEVRSIEHLGVVTIALLLALLRFRQPVIVLGLGLCATLLAFALAREHMAEAPARLVLAACGILFLVTGFMLDMRDRSRTGIYHEWALWLFVLGSPLTVHPLFLGLIGEQLAATGTRSLNDFIRLDLEGLIWAVTALAAGFALLGLLLDRRSLVASTLLYLAAILTYATFRSGLGLSTAAAIVPLTIGILVILLGVGWDHARAALLRIVPFRSAFRPPTRYR